MGFEVPAALGAQIGRPGTTVWSVCGDGGFQMTMCDIATGGGEPRRSQIRDLENNSLGLGQTTARTLLREGLCGQRVLGKSRLR
ncbi:MAG: hypothetical protein Ct9H300mP11_13670 [Chloroflexota bacterium]|nr:MAG: hypothetical protein Ct9H300mP11_13670 [Chloroflexota bacterium]